VSFAVSKLDASAKRSVADSPTDLRGKCVGHARGLRVVSSPCALQTENVAARALATQSKEDPVMAPASTFLAPGQRYAPPGTPSWQLAPQVTVLQVFRDPDGTECIVHRCPNGQTIMIMAAELEAAVEAGQLVPVAASSQSDWC
jgi:hypothetical protein